MGRRKPTNRQLRRQQHLDDMTNKSNRDKKVDAQFKEKNRSGNTKSTYGEKENSNNDLRVTLEAKTETQGLMIATMSTNIITFGIGPAGTGKTCAATLYAAEQLHKRNFKKIILTRPVVEIGKTMGHLPGDINEKYEPYLAPYKKHLIEAFGRSGYEARLGNSIIPAPLNFIQGESWDDSIILVDEAQNMTIQEMFMLLTRIGKNTKVIITGDIHQTANSSLAYENGLKDFVTRYKASYGLFQHCDISIIEFTEEDIVRHDVVQRIVKFYNKY